MSRLRTENLQKHFGGLAAVAGVTIVVETGERRAVIGPNGAGKTTLFNLITGELSSTGGMVYLDGQDITTMPVHTRANLGLGHTFQRNNLFSGLSALENVRLAVQHHRGVAPIFFRAAKTFNEVTAEAVGIMEQVGLSSNHEQIASTLAYGQQRALEIALALATDPQVLLLDEPTAGMSAAETKDMVQLIDALPRTITLLIVEHDMEVVFRLADRITVMHYGEVVNEGVPNEIRADATVQEIYLGAASSGKSDT